MCALAGKAARAVKRARVAAAAVLLVACNAGPLELAGADDRDAAVSVANGVDPQIDPQLLPPGAPDRGIYLYWLFDTDSLSTSVDASGHQRAGQFLNLPSLSDAAPTARTGNQRGLFLNGTGQAVAYTLNVPLSALSFGLWVKPACNAACRVLSLNAAPSAPVLSLSLNAASQFQLDSAAPTAPDAGALSNVNASAIGTTLVVNERWYYVAGTVNAAGEAQLFVNGKAEASATGSTPGSATQLMLGADSNAPAGFRGVLDEVIVYDWAVPAAALAQLAAAP